MDDESIEIEFRIDEPKPKNRVKSRSAAPVEKFNRQSQLNRTRPSASPIMLKSLMSTSTNRSGAIQT
jgi:hypothetical protein